MYQTEVDRLTCELDLKPRPKGYGDVRLIQFVGQSELDPTARPRLILWKRASVLRFQTISPAVRLQ
jgi:hypothetical protein